MYSLKSHRICCALLGATLAVGVAVVPEVGNAQQITQTHNSSKVLVQAPVNTTTGTLAGAFSGILNVTHFAVQNGQIVATGQLTGTVTDLAGNVIGTVSQQVTTLVSGANASCSILSLTLGPLHLDVLGLVIDLNQVNLNITAQPGPGNLLGNLLCDVANLLNGNGLLSTIVSDLNMILKNL